MNEAASLYWVDLRLEPIPDVLDLDYLRMIHRRLLSPVVEWAGELRQAGDEVIADDTGIVYAMSVFFRDGLDDVFAQLAGEDYLTGLGADEFTDGLAARAPQRQLGRARPPMPRHKRTTAPQQVRTPSGRSGCSSGASALRCANTATTSQGAGRGLGAAADGDDTPTPYTLRGR